MPDRSLLHQALRSNALFSAISALAMLFIAEWIAAQIGLSDVAVIYSAAVLLLLFSLQLGNIVRTKAIRRWEISSIIAADIGWVIGSAIFVVAFYPAISRWGLLLIDVAALAVLYFAIQQIRGLRALPTESTATR